jgi:rSAM/selenodomain-associated transferase 2
MIESQPVRGECVSKAAHSPILDDRTGIDDLEKPVPGANRLSPFISIVVPVLNEAAIIEQFLKNLRERAAPAEIIVADGGSSDGTRQRAASICDRVLLTKPGRAIQLNTGAKAASGEVLWFLHADCEVPCGCLHEITRSLLDPLTVGGFFRIRIPRRDVVYRLTDSFAHYAGLLLRMRFGDHGFFCRRVAFEKIGGYPDVPLMEDAQFFRQLKGLGRVVVLRSRLVVSPRRYDAVGPMRLSLIYGLIAMLYAMRVPLPLLATIYRRTCAKAHGEASSYGKHTKA